MNKKNIFTILSVCAGAFFVCGTAVAAASRSPAKQAAIQRGTQVRTKLEATGLYEQACYDAFFGCMDQFCITDNSDGGSCGCSDLNADYEKQLAEIHSSLAEATRISTIEVEKVKAGANADIIFTGTRRYDENGNPISVDELSSKDKKEKKKADLLALWDSSVDLDGLWDDDGNLADKTGNALFVNAEEICINTVPANCEKDLPFLRQLYGRQIVADCKAFENALATKRESANLELANADAAVRTALQESFSAANKYDLGQCMVEFKKCMQTEDACGKNWENCVATIASENMQNKKAASTAGSTVATVEKYDITASTQEILDSKRFICENVLTKCVAVRDMVWPAFLRDVAPTIKLAESQAESKFRRSCLTSIADCIQTACRDDIVGRGIDTMDACLSRPDMVRSFCKVEIDPCERMEPLIWGYVSDKLAAMRVDACTKEVKDCFTADNRCGENFENCVGMDYDYIHKICPIDSLVVCKQNNSNFSMSDLDSMLMGLYLNIDNALIDRCQDLVDAKMTEICGSTTDCNRFAADNTIGTGSLRPQKDGTIYRITGMISFGSIKMGDAAGSVKVTVDDKQLTLKPGEIDVSGYLQQIKEKNTNVPNATEIITSIEEELNNIAGTINRTIEMIEQDPEIQFCVSGRDLSQINGQSGSHTKARFPNLLNQIKMQIAVAALRQAQDNYNAKLNSAIADATSDASLDVAQYMCQMLPYNNGALFDAETPASTPLTVPYAISYDISSGLDNTKLVRGTGHSVAQLSETAKLDSNASSTKFSEVISSISGLGTPRVKFELPSGTREMWSVFNREARVCHYCTSIVTKNCSAVSKKGFLGIGNKSEQSCTESEPIEKCEDIQM